MFRTADWPHYFEQQPLLNRRRWVKPVGSVCRPAVTVLFLPGAGVEFRLFDCESWISDQLVEPARLRVASGVPHVSDCGLAALF